MDARPSLRELFAELSRTGGDPADLLRAAGYGDVPEPLMAEAIVNYAGTAPLEVAEHLAPFAVAHGPVPVPDPGAVPSSGLSLLASAPAVDVHGLAADTTVPVEHDVHDVHGAVADHLADHVDVDPSGLDDDTSAHAGAPHELHHGDIDHGDIDPAGVDGLHPGSPPLGPVGSGPHSDLGSFGAGHGGEPADDRAADDRQTDDGDAGHHADPFLAHEHVQDVDEDDHGVSDHDPVADTGDTTTALLDHDDHADHADPADLLDDDGHHHP
jgi:hypothetical protein